VYLLLHDGGAFVYVSRECRQFESFTPRVITLSRFRPPTDAMANSKARSALIVALVVFTGLRHSTFVPAPARGVAPMAAAGGMLAMLGAPAAHADKIDDAAKKLSEASYPFLKEIDWTSDVYAKLPTAGWNPVLKAVDKMIVMGAAMDGAALKAGADAHHKAIGSIDAKGVTSLADYTAVNAAIGHMVASAGQAKTMDVYNAFAGFNLGKDVGPYMMSKVNAGDASAAYSAFLEFKEAVKASL
jgi:hypothetical protein